MSRADEIRERYDAELAVIELEDELADLKGKKKPDEAKLAQVKADLREARQYWRELRAGATEVTPATITTTATVKET